MLCLCRSNHSRSMLCLCSARLRNSVPSHVRSKLSLALAVHFTAKLFLRCSLQREAAQCVASPFRCFSFLGYAFPFSAALFLRIARHCFSSAVFSPAMPRLAFAPPCHTFPLLFQAMQCLCRAMHCDAVPLPVEALLCSAFPLPVYTLPCHSLLCPCAADQETSAQRKRPLPELRHWPRPR